MNFALPSLKGTIPRFVGPSMNVTQPSGTGPPLPLALIVARKLTACP